jgi:hypothetical protein
MPPKNIWDLLVRAGLFLCFVLMFAVGIALISAVIVGVAFALTHAVMLYWESPHGLLCSVVVWIIISIYAAYKFVRSCPIV